MYFKLIYYTTPTTNIQLSMYQKQVLQGSNLHHPSAIAVDSRRSTFELKTYAGTCVPIASNSNKIVEINFQTIQRYFQQLTAMIPLHCTYPVPSYSESTLEVLRLIFSETLSCMISQICAFAESHASAANSYKQPHAHKPAAILPA